MLLSACLQLGDTAHIHQLETDALQERNVHLRQLARRAKHLASVLEVSNCCVTSLSSVVHVSVSYSFCVLSETNDSNRERAHALAESLQAAAAGRGI